MSNNQPAAWPPVKSRSALVDGMEYSPQEDDADQADHANGKAMLPSLLAGARRGAEKVAKFVKSGQRPIDIDTKLVEKYEFKTGGIHRGLTLSHADSVWQVKVDSEVVANKNHCNSSFARFSTSVDFTVPVSAHVHGSIEAPKATMHMEWSPLAAKWQYTLSVDGVSIKPCWTKASGYVENNEVPEVAPDFQRSRVVKDAVNLCGIPEPKGFAMEYDGFSERPSDLQRSDLVNAAIHMCGIPAPAGFHEDTEVPQGARGTIASV
jgi:hypothetical protein